MSLERIGSYNGAEEMALQPGTTLGPYEIVSLLGVGGMGEVYLAREVSLGRNVALKVLPSDFTHDVHRVARFEQEARSASALSHPNICTIYALGELSDGRRFIAMEHVTGETLRHRLTTSRLAVREAVDIGTQIAAALSAAHSAGIVHRDIKPENVMLRPDGFVKVLDFGLAKLTVPSDSAATASTQTAFRTDAHTVLGTIAYMSPEQARGQQVDTRSDVWALGVVLYEMAAGHSPFRGETGSDVLAAILDREPESLSRFDALISQELQRIVSKMLRKNRDERYQTMKDAELDLRAFLRVTDAGQVQVSASGSIPGHEAQVPSLKRRELSVWLNSVVGLRRGVTVAAIIAVLMGAGLVVNFWNRKTNNDRPVVADRASPTLTRLTANPVDLPITNSVISPDGRYLAASDREGVQVRVIDTGETHRLPNTAGMTVIGWSADSTRVRATGCESELCTAWSLSLGGNSRTRTPGTWPISDHVFGLPNGVGVLRFTEMGPLIVDPMDGSPPRVIERGVQNFAVTPDGTRLFFLRGQVEIRTVSLSGGVSTAVWRSKPDSSIVDLVALPDNRLILALQRTTRETATALCELRTDGMGGVAGEPRRLTDWRTDTIANLTASSDGRRVAFALVNSQPDLYVANFNYASHRLSQPWRATSNTSVDVVTSWTPDSSAVLFASNQSGTYDIWKYDINTKVPELFVGGPGDQWWAKLSSEGQYVFYNDRSPAAAVRLMRVPVSGGVGQIVGPVGPSTFVHCAFGKRCVLLDVDREEILELDVIHGLGRRLGVLPPSTRTAGILPSGDEVVVEVPSETGRRNRLRVISLSGRPPREFVVANAQWLVTLEGSAAGRGLFAVNVTAKASELLFVEPDGSSRSLIKPGTFDLGLVIPSPDGEHIVFSAYTGQTDAWMMSEF